MKGVLKLQPTDGMHTAPTLENARKNRKIATTSFRSGSHQGNRLFPIEAEPPKSPIEGTELGCDHPARPVPLRIRVFELDSQPIVVFLHRKEFFCLCEFFPSLLDECLSRNAHHRATDTTLVLLPSRSISIVGAHDVSGHSLGQHLLLCFAPMLARFQSTSRLARHLLFAHQLPTVSAGTRTGRLFNLFSQPKKRARR